MRRKRTSARMLARIVVGLVLTAVGSGLIVATAGPAVATWSATNCTGSAYPINIWKRWQAQAFALEANKEGYEWGGGCYRLNDRDDTPNAPDSGGEGNDCSGFVFRVWALKADGTPGFEYWEMRYNIHGPYTTASYYYPRAEWQFRRIEKSYVATAFMDAFVYRSGDSGHIGLIYSEGTGGGDYIIHAKSDADGTTITYETYRSSSAFRGVARRGWTRNCYPRLCP